MMECEKHGADFAISEAGATGFFRSCQNRFTPKEIEFDFPLYPQGYGPSLERYKSLPEWA